MVMRKPQKRIKNKVKQLRQTSESNSVLLEKFDQIDKGQYGQFTLRDDFWPKCLIKYRKLKL